MGRLAWGCGEVGAAHARLPALVPDGLVSADCWPGAAATAYCLLVPLTGSLGQALAAGGGPSGVNPAGLHEL